MVPKVLDCSGQVGDVILQVTDPFVAVVAEHSANLACRMTMVDRQSLSRRFWFWLSTDGAVALLLTSSSRFASEMP